jgi:hypothetical protein
MITEEQRLRRRQNAKGCLIGFLILAVLIVALAAYLGESKSAAERDGSDLVFTTISGQVEGVVLRPDMPSATIDRAVRKHCAGKQWCKVLGWVEGDKIATAFPMTNREAAAVVYELTINRATGYDRSSFACTIWRDRPKTCFTPETEEELQNAS